MWSSCCVILRQKETCSKNKEGKGKQNAENFSLSSQLSDTFTLTFNWGSLSLHSWLTDLLFFVSRNSSCESSLPSSVIRVKLPSGNLEGHHHSIHDVCGSQCKVTTRGVTEKSSWTHCSRPWEDSCYDDEGEEESNHGSTQFSKLNRLHFVRIESGHLSCWWIKSDCIAYVFRNCQRDSLEGGNNVNKRRRDKRGTSQQVVVSPTCETTRYEWMALFFSPSSSLFRILFLEPFFSSLW